MSNDKKKQKGNVAGKYYVGQECIGCTLCSEITPANFEANLEEGFNYVCKQPDTDDEYELCDEAMRSCPVNAIVNDGTI